MAKMDEYEAELNKLREIFKDVDNNKVKLIDGLIQDAAFLYSENKRLKGIIEKTGTIKVHPGNPGVQKPTEAAKQYLKNINSYSTVMKTLNSILAKHSPEDEDELDLWVERERKAAHADG